MTTHTSIFTRISLLTAGLLSADVLNAHDGHGLDAIPHDVLHAAGFILLPVLILAVRRALLAYKKSRSD